MSDMVPMYGFGGGGGGLNFKVVGGTTQPTNPTENTIWVNTSVSITDWVFIATEPTAPKEGMVWIYTGTSSSSEFNALKKNRIQVYPLGAKQYVGSAWVNKTAKSYQNGAWVDLWNGVLFDNGDRYDFITGGWNGSVGSVISVTGSETTHNAHTKKMIDLSGKSKLYATVASVTSVPTGASFGIGIRLAKSIPASSSTTANQSPIMPNEVVALAGAKSATTLSIDVSNIDIPVCVVVVGHPNGGAGTVTRIWTE